MKDSGRKNADKFFLRIQAPFTKANRFVLHLRDSRGNEDSGELTVKQERTVSGVAFTWADFLMRYVKDEVTEDEFKAFGHDLFCALIKETGLAEAWSGILSASGGHPLVMITEFSRNTEVMAELPLELLHDDANFVFARPGFGLERTLLGTPSRDFVVPSKPNVLFAWACPPGSGDAFDPSPHKTALRAVFGERVNIVDNATLDSVENALEKSGFDYLHILAHGYRDSKSAGICLTGEKGGIDFVMAQRLANGIQGRNLILAFLCSCQTAVAKDKAFSGVGQQLLVQEGGDIPCVVATQANLPVRDSEKLVERFYRLLAETKNPAQALARARRDAFDKGHMAWSVPVLLARPSGDIFDIVPTVSRGLPDRKLTYQSRELEQEGLVALSKNRFVSLVGLPGIGKTETGKEISRTALEQGMFDRVIYQDVLPGYTIGQIRGLLGTALGQTGIGDDLEMAAVFNARPEKFLLVLDNAEDLMKIPDDEAAFRGMIDTLLGHAARLSILLTTRWLLGGTQIQEREVEVPPMTPGKAATLLKAELQQKGTFKPEWPGIPAWQEILEIIDGHPRSLWLIAGHFDRRRGTPENVLAKLNVHRENAIVEPGMLGRADIFHALRDDQKRRLHSLVASMNLSFDVLEERHPDAAEVYLGLSLFPAGLPDKVVQEVAGGAGSLALEHLYRYHLVAWHNERTFYPVPLYWYAERLRSQRDIDESVYMSRALDAFDEYVTACDKQITTGSIVAGVDALLADEANLLTLAVWTKYHGEKGTQRSRLASIAIASANGLQFSNRLDTFETLINQGLVLAIIADDLNGEANCLKSLGELQMRMDNLAGAKSSYDAALPIFREIRDRLGEANCLKSLGELQMRMDDLTGAKLSYDAALLIYREIRARLGEANCLKSLGKLQMRMDDPTDAKSSYDAALPIFREIRDRLGEANCLKSLGDLRMRMADLAGAKSFYDAALFIFREIRNRLGEANCLQSLGELRMRMDDPNGAKSSYDTALIIFREIRNRLGEANCLKSLGDLQMRMTDLAGAKSSYNSALFIYREIRDRLGEANCLQSLGELQMRMADPNGAKSSYDTALIVFREIQHRLGEANCLKSLGELQMRMADPNGAKSSYNAALFIYREIQHRLGEANCLKSLGDLRMRMADLAGAKSSYDAALFIYREIRDRLGEANCLQSLGELRMRIDDPNGAKSSYDTALIIFREIQHRLGEANCLKSLGDLQMRMTDLAGAKSSYNSALFIYREIRDRLGEANCLQSLGELRMRTTDLAGAKSSYDAALLIFREIRDRLGEASCLQSQGLLMLISGNTTEAFKRFTEVLELFRGIKDKMGQQSTLGYLARTAHKAGAPDQALLLAEESLDLGRQINDRFGQSITLKFQLQIFQSLKEVLPILAVMVLLRNMLVEIGDSQMAAHYAATLEKIKPPWPDEGFQDLEENAEAVRESAIADARNRFENNSRDLFDPPDVRK